MIALCPKHPRSFTSDPHEVMKRSWNEYETETVSCHFVNCFTSVAETST